MNVVSSQKMPTQSSITQIRLDNIQTCLKAAVTTAEVVLKGLKTPFLEPIVNTVRSLLGAVQVVFRLLRHIGTDQRAPEN